MPAHAPRDLWEAIQMYWFVHLGTVTELNGWDSMNPGHIDQHLFPFYQKGIEDGTLTRDKAKELLSCSIGRLCTRSHSFQLHIHRFESLHDSCADG